MTRPTVDLRAALETHLRWLRFHVSEPHISTNETARTSYQHAADMLQALLTDPTVIDDYKARQDEMVHQACAATIQMFGGTMAIQAANYMAECLLNKPPASGVSMICAERCRQIQVEGWTPAHDDRHENGELLSAAVWYIDDGCEYDLGLTLPPWPFEQAAWKPLGVTWSVRSLVKAGALIAAEIDRLQRRDGQSAKSGDNASVSAVERPDDPQDSQASSVTAEGRCSTCFNITSAPHAGLADCALAFVAQFKGDDRCSLNRIYSEALAERVASLTRDQQEAWKCQARASTDPPQDCDWPMCGCDAYAYKVLEALREQAKCANHPDADYELRCLQCEEDHEQEMGAYDLECRDWAEDPDSILRETVDNASVIASLRKQLAERDAQHKATLIGYEQEADRLTAEALALREQLADRDARIVTLTAELVGSEKDLRTAQGKYSEAEAKRAQVKRDCATCIAAERDTAITATIDRVLQIVRGHADWVIEERIAALRPAPTTTEIGG